MCPLHQPLLSSEPQIWPQPPTWTHSSRLIALVKANLFKLLHFQLVQLRSQLVQLKPTAWQSFFWRAKSLIPLGIKVSGHYILPQSTGITQHIMKSRVSSQTCKEMWNYCLEHSRILLQTGDLLVITNSFHRHFVFLGSSEPISIISCSSNPDC